VKQPVIDDGSAEGFFVANFSPGSHGSDHTCCYICPHCIWVTMKGKRAVEMIIIIIRVPDFEKSI
jgi:hypothetical protein